MITNLPRSTSRIGGVLLRLAVLASTPLLFGAICAGGDDEIEMPELTPFAAGLEGQLHEIRATAADVRGLAINEETVEGQLTNDQLRAYSDEFYAELDADEQAELDAYNIAFRLLHLIGPDDDLQEIGADYFSENVAGLYFREKNSLVLVGDASGGIDARAEMTLAHEYVHSFQHGAFDTDYLGSLQKDVDETRGTEYSETVSCLIEGDATLSSVLYMEDVYGENWLDIVYPDAPADPPASEDSTPPGMQRYFSFEYRECYWFVSSLYRDGGWAAVDAAYASPPFTTEQILHPEKYETGEASRSAASPSLEKRLGDGWERLDVVPFGEFDVYNYLASVLEDEIWAANAAAGWGSGWMSVYSAAQDDTALDPDVLLHIRLGWDTEADYWEFVFAYGAAIDIIADGRWHLDDAARKLRWQGDGEYGLISWNNALNRVDVYISPNEATREMAVTRP